MLKQITVFTSIEAEWIPCGLLRFNEAGRFSSAQFRYGKRYLERRDAVSIDPVYLPLIDGEQETPDGFELFNGIRDAAPDRWGRYLLDKKFSRSLSEIEYAAASGIDRVGALAFGQSVEAGPQIYQLDGSFIKPPKVKRLNLEECLGAVEDALASIETQRLKNFLSYGPSIGGARPKTSVTWKKKPHIAKFSVSLDTKNEPLVEYATMTLAKAAGLDVPNVFLETVLGRSVYLIERFDRDENDHRKGFISGLTITGTHESDWSNWSYFAIADALRKFSSKPERDLKELYARMVFNIAVYNNDDHLRNFGFLYSGNNNWDLSPLYDVVPSPVKTETYSLAMTLGAQGKKASYENALSMHSRFLIEKTEALAIVERIKDTVSNWTEHFRNVGATDVEIKMLENSFRLKA